MADLVVIEDVEIVSTGTYQLQGNSFNDGQGTTITQADLEAAIEAVDDPHIKAPRLKLGHIGNEEAWNPAFGVVANLRLDENGHTLLGDFHGVPKWLADVMPTAWPNRSVEAQLDFKTQSGEHKLVITAVALLGISMPGVTSLEDLEFWFGDEMPEGVEMSKELEGQINIDEVRRAFYKLPVSRGNAWIREILLDPMAVIIDNDGELLKMDFTIEDNEVEFGDDIPVREEFVEAKSVRIYASKEASKKGLEVTVNIRAQLGLPEDASDKDVENEIKKLQARSGNKDEGDDTGTVSASKEDEREDEKETETVAASVTVPDGMSLVDTETLNTLKAGAEDGRAARAAQVKAERDNILDTAIRAGKFPPGRREHYEKALEADFEGFSAVIEGMPEGLIPVGKEVGAAGTTTKEGTQTIGSLTAAWKFPGHSEPSEEVTVNGRS